MCHHGGSERGTERERWSGRKSGDFQCSRPEVGWSGAHDHTSLIKCSFDLSGLCPVTSTWLVYGESVCRWRTFLLREHGMVRFPLPNTSGRCCPWRFLPLLRSVLPRVYFACGHSRNASPFTTSIISPISSLISDILQQRYNISHLNAEAVTQCLSSG